MVWARELLHGDLATADGPAFKALPVLVVAPLTPLGEAGPLLWLALARSSALLALLLAYRVSARIAGPVAGVAAALLLAADPDLYRTALYGSSEPLLIVLVLAAAERHLAGRRGSAFALLALAGLIRPEAWPIVAALAALSCRLQRRLDPVALASALVPPVLWLGLAWLGSGHPFNEFVGLGAAVRGGPSAGAPLAARLAPPPAAAALVVLRRMGEAIGLPALVFAAAATVVARRQRRAVLLLGAIAVAWVAIVAVMAQLGYPGSRRYLAAPVALLAVLAGVGVAGTLALVAQRRTRRLTALALGALLCASAFPTARTSVRLVGVARAEDRQRAQLGTAVDLAGGRAAVVAYGCPAINPWEQSAFAWRLHVPLERVQATWHSSRAAPHWRPPAVVFRAPGHLAGPPPVLPRRWRSTLVGRSGSWEVLRASAGAAVAPRCP
jgi:hypothetical protein